MEKGSYLQQLREITDRLEESVKDLFESGRFQEYLRTMSRFYNYSFHNTLLIAMQKPDATLIAGYTAWKKNFDRHVKRNEKGIRIIAPAPYKAEKDVVCINSNTGQPVIGTDGKPVTEKKEITIPAFKIVCVFDISQTEGKELPSIMADQLAGEVANYKALMDILEEISPVPISFEKISGGAHGYYHPAQKRIAIAADMSELQTVKTLIHEIAHAKLHAVTDTGKSTVQKDRHTKEVEAESVAYTVCQHFGIDTSDYSFGYIAGWSSGQELPELKASLETIHHASAEIIESICTKSRLLSIPAHLKIDPTAFQNDPFDKKQARPERKIQPSKARKGRNMER